MGYITENALLLLCAGSLEGQCLAASPSFAFPVVSELAVTMSGDGLSHQGLLGGKSNAVPGEWIPSKSDVASLDRLLIARSIRGVPVVNRVRAYSGTVENGRKYIIGMLLTPTWSSAGKFDLTQRDVNIIESWDRGFYRVRKDKFPGRVPSTMGNGCEYMKVIYDVQRNEILKNACFL